MDILRFDLLDSTNTYAKNHIDELKDMTCIQAIKQNKGKGRREKVWFSNEDSLTFSVVIKDHLDLRDVELASLKTGYLLFNFLKNYTNDLLIKWPNDILLNQKKLAGILVETVFQKDFKALIIGIGINIKQKCFPKELENSATSLSLETHQEYDLSQFLSDFLGYFEKQYHLINHKKMINSINKHLAFKDQMIQYQSKQGQNTAKCLKVNQNGHLLVQSKDKTIELTHQVISNIRL